MAMTAIHGHAKKGRTSKYFWIWCSMRARCYKKRDREYCRYGARGIKVCKRWRKSFAKFLKDVGRRPSPNHTLERIDNNSNYEPCNVRWATRAEQMRNTRRNLNLSFQGRTMCVTDWAKEVGIKRATIYRRLKSGWSVEEALTTPI